MQQVREVLDWLAKRGSQRNRYGMARYGIVARKAFGVSMGTMQSLAKRLGRDHALALALWKSGWHEARMLCAFVEDPARVTPAQMDAWAADFDNWAVCDTLCFKLFDRTPHAWRKAAQWSRKKDEFVKRAGFALMASLALHDRTATEDRFRTCFPLIERGAIDDRNFVKKAVNWALRSIGNRSPALYADALALARRLAASDNPAARWIGTDAVRDLNRPLVKARIARRTSNPKRHTSH